jgi:hypothetical protein
MVTSRLVVGLSICVLLGGAATHASGQTGGGAIVGVVKDETGAAVPGVTVTAESPALIERFKTATTRSTGEYRIVDLRPGTYTVTFSLGGFKTVKREGLGLDASFNATVNAVLSIGTLEETLTVSGESPLVDVRSNVSERALTQDLLEGVPVGRTAYQVALLVPGAVTTRPDVGGSETGQSTNLSIHGSSGQDIAWNADGLNINAAHAGGQITGLYYNQGFNEEISIQSKALPAEVESGGIVVNMIKKQGSNTLKGDLHLSYTGNQFQSSNVSDEQRSLGLVYPGAMDRSYDVNATVGGPILKDKLWFAASYRRWRIDRLQANTLDIDGNQELNEQLLWNYSGSLTYQVNKSNQLSGFIDYSDKIRDHRRDQTADYRFVFTEASYRSPNRGPMIGVKWKSTLRDDLLLEAGFSYIGDVFTLEYQPGIAADALPRNDIARSTLTGAAPHSLTHEGYARKIGSAVVSWLPTWKGPHQIKVGGHYSRMPYPQQRSTLGHGDLVARYRSGVPDSVMVFNTPINSHVTHFGHGLFVQDSWTIQRRFTVNAGVRFDYFRGRVDEGNAPAGRFVPARHFPEIDNVPNWKTLVPRFAFVYDLFGNGKTALKANASKYMRRDGANIINLVNPMRLNSEIRSWTDANTDGVPQLDEIGPARGALDRGATVRLDPDLRRPQQWEFTASLDHQLLKDLAVSVSYYHRRYSNLYATVNAALRPSDYMPVTITNPLTNQPLTIYNQNPATASLVDNVLTNSPDLSSKYNGFEVSLNKRMANNFMLFAGFTVSSNKECSAAAASTNPNDRINACGYSPFDSRYITNVSGIYQLPHGFHLSSHFQYVTGRPTRRDFVVTRALVPNLTQVNQRVTLVPAGDLRLPAWSLLDVRVSKVFQVGKVLVEPLLDLYNLLNENAPLSEVTTVGPALGRVSENVDGRLIRFGAKLSF